MKEFEKGIQLIKSLPIADDFLNIFMKKINLNSSTDKTGHENHYHIDTSHFSLPIHYEKQINGTKEWTNMYENDGNDVNDVAH